MFLSINYILTLNHIRGPFEKFVDSPYYSGPERFGGAVTVYFRSTSLGKRCTSYNAPPTSRERAADRRSSLFMVAKARKSHGARSGLNSVFGLEKVDLWNPIRTSIIHSRSRPMRFLGFSNHEKRAQRQEISKWSTVCSTFSRRGWSVVRSASLVKEGTSKRRPSPHLHKVPTRSNKVSTRNFQTTLVDVFTYALSLCFSNFDLLTMIIKNDSNRCLSLRKIPTIPSRCCPH
jgi:hypothetical protein